MAFPLLWGAVRRERTKEGPRWKELTQEPHNKAEAQTIYLEMEF